MDVEPPSPIAAVLAVAVAVPLRRFRIRKSLLRMGHCTFVVNVWGAAASVFAARSANVWARAGDVFVARGGSLGTSYLASYIDVVDCRHGRPFTFVFGTEGLVALFNVLASLRIFENMFAHFVLFAGLVPGMFRLAWRLIRVRLCLASAWPIRLGIVRARAVVAFAVRGAASAMPFHELGGTRRYFPFCVAAVFILDPFAAPLDSFFGSHWSHWVFVARGARSRLPFLVTHGTMHPSPIFVV